MSEGSVGQVGALSRAGARGELGPALASALGRRLLAARVDLGVHLDEHLNTHPWWSPLHLRVAQHHC